MAPLGRLPIALRAAAGIGALEAAGLAGYGISILAFERDHATSGISGSGTSLAPLVLVVLYWVFAGLIAFVAWQLLALRSGARTPYYVTQAFALVVAQPLIAETGTRFLGLLVAVVGIAGVYALVAARSAFDARSGT